MGIWLKFKGWIIAVAGVVGSALMIYAYGRHRGSEDTEIEIQRADYEKARKIEDAADRARRADGDNVPAIDRLQRYGRLRDAEDDL